jgi:HAD superfamily hydrolase (TIGR01509 family)
MDGSLLDTEPIHLQAHLDQCAALGIEVTVERIEQNVGLGDDVFYQNLCIEAGRPDPGPAAGLAMAKAKEALLFERYRRYGVSSGAGVEQVYRLARRRGLPQCLVTSSRRAAARLAMRGQHWHRRLTNRVCSEDVRQHKPRPMPYRLAALRLRMPPCHLLVFEDSPAGVTAARAAGCTVVGLSGIVPAERLRSAGADIVVPHAWQAIVA